MPDGSRYDEDFYLWTRDQSERLRAAASARSNLELDWTNLAEEVESVGNSERRELRSRIIVLLEHLLKLRYSPAAEPRHGWRDTIRHQRLVIDLLLKDSPSLRGKVPELADEMFSISADQAATALRSHGESVDNILTDLEKNRDILEGLLTREFFPERS